MHPRILASRSAAAQARIAAAAEQLAAGREDFGEKLAALSAYDRDPDTRALLRQEATAALLESLAEDAPGASKPRGRSGPRRQESEADLAAASERADPESVAPAKEPAREKERRP